MGGETHLIKFLGIAFCTVFFLIGCRTTEQSSVSYQVDPSFEIQKSHLEDKSVNFASLVDFAPKQICFDALPLDLHSKYGAKLREDPWYRKTSSGYIIEHGEFYVRFFVVGAEDVRYADFKGVKPNFPPSKALCVPFRQLDIKIVSRNSPGLNTPNVELVWVSY
jgi:hypothetical protein